MIIGGGMVGCEVADFLYEQGKEITIVGIVDELYWGAGSLQVSEARTLVAKR